MSDIDLSIRFDSSSCWICGAPCARETMKTHKVPIRDIIEKGLRQQDLKNYPEILLEES